MFRFSNRLWVAFFVAFTLTLASGKQSKPVSFVPRSSATVPSTINIADASQRVTSSSQSLQKQSSNVHPIVTARGGASPLATKDEFTGAMAFVVLDYAFRKAFAAYNINFPSQLGGCCILFIFMLLAQIIKPGLGDSIFKSLLPGSLLLAKGLPIFFVPGLAMLPLAPSMGSIFEIMKCLFVVVFGFYFSASTTACAVLAIRKMEGSAINGPVVKASNGGNSAPPKPFSQDLLDLLTKGLVLSGIASVAATRLNNEYANPIRTLFMIITTFAGYVWGARLPAGFVKVVHPIVTSTIVTHIVTQLCAFATGDTFNNVLASYKAGSMAFKATGAGDILLYLLGPSVVSFAISMYSRKNVIAENLLVVCTAMIIGSVGGLFGTALMVRLLAIGGATGAILRKSLLPRNITTPLAIPITKILNGDIPLACVFVVLTGIYGGTYGRSFMDSIGITDPVARGLGIGASAQGLGVASMTSEKEAFPFAAISMVLTAVAATVLVSIPSIKDTIVNVATGN